MKIMIAILCLRVLYAHRQNRKLKELTENIAGFCERNGA